jgi:regulator of PEP synthase PpsR (kinase-PPPase family)
MGIFTSNTLSSISGVDYSDLPALEGYDAVTGCATAMLEVHQNDMALFNAAIMEDFKEVAAMNEGVTVLNESASDVLNKIKEIFKKLLQKIKGIFNAFIAKLSQTFGSAESVYNKYKKQISAYNKWGKFEVKKFREVKGKGSVLAKLVEVGKYSQSFSYITTNTTAGGTILTKESIDTDEINKKLIGERIGYKSLASDIDDDFKNMDVAFMNAVYEDEDTKDDWNVSDILGGNIGTLLEKNAGKKFKENIEAANKNLNDVISKIIDELDKEALKINDAAGAANRKEMDKAKYSSKIISATGAGMDASGKEKRNNLSNNYGMIVTGSKELSQSIANLQKVAAQEQTLITSFTSARLKATKFAIAQARRVWSSAAAYSSIEHKNEGVEFYTAIGEAAEYDFISDMESICG